MIRKMPHVRTRPDGKSALSSDRFVALINTFGRVSCETVYVFSICMFPKVILSRHF